jgi:hypothetical protein
MKTPMQSTVEPAMQATVSCSKSLTIFNHDSPNAWESPLT